MSENPAPSSAAVVQAYDNPVQFGFGIAPGADAHLQRAAHLVSSRQDALAALQDAYAEAPDQVETLVAMFKLLFYQGETDKAESLVLEALDKASSQGGFAGDWSRLQPGSTDWEDPRGPGRLYLYSLKALAFIRLRQGDLDQARTLLQTIGRIDPLDQVGADVIRDLLHGVEEESDDG